MRHSQEALNSLRAVRTANPNVSQRRLARNIYANVRPDLATHPDAARSNDSMADLDEELGYPSEVALQHLIRRIDRQARITSINPMGASRSPRNRTSPNRNRKTVSRSRRTRA